MKKIVISIAGLFLLTACETFMTRTDVRDHEQKRQMQDQVINLQKSNADVNSRFSDIESELRGMNGRVEVLENKLSASNRERDNLRDANQDANKKIQLLQDELARQEKDIQALSSELGNVKSAVAAGLSSSGASREGGERETPKEKKSQYDIAEELFSKKDYKKAALAYQKFKETNSKSKKVADATYKMGLCFQELGMNDDARAFFEEVISKYPDTPEAKRAKSHLKSLKK